MALVTKTFSDIITFTRASGATWFNSAGILQGVDFSVTSNTIGTGSKTFTLTATGGVNRYWTAGDTVLISDQANSANNMVGTVTSYNASTQVLVCNITSTGGSGTLTAWRIGSTMPRFDFNPTTLAARGLLIEEARTNSIRNNTMQGAVAGTPGTEPTNWASSGSGSGVTREIVGVGTENGIAYADVRYYGTPSASSSVSISFEQTNQIAATAGQTWTESVFVKLQAGSFTNTSTTVSLLATNGVSGTEVFNSTAITSTPADLRNCRLAVSGTLAAALGTTHVQPRIRIGYTVGVAFDITLRVGLPQLENNNISTGVASATVASGGSGYAIGDVLQIVGGTGSTAARLTVATLSGSAVATVTVSTAGSYSVFPSPQPVSVTAITGTGTSATFNIVPQTQTGFATSVIPTTTTPLTRNADQASVNTLSPWYRADEGTLFVDASPQVSNAASCNLAELNDATASNRIGLFKLATTGNASLAVLVSGATQASTNSGAWTATGKLAGAYKLDDFASSLNGSAAAIDTLGALPTVTQLTLGRRGDGANLLNGHLRRITYYPRRLSNAELQAITTP